MRGVVNDNLNMIMGSRDQETVKIYEIQRETQSLRHELREQQWTLEEKYQHEARVHGEYGHRCEVCVRVREQWCDNDVEQVNIDLRHRVTEHQDEDRKLKQVGELKRVEQKARDEKKAALKAKSSNCSWNRTMHIGFGWSPRRSRCTGRSSSANRRWM